MPFSRFLLLQFSTAHVELHALQARFIPTHYVHFDAHVDNPKHTWTILSVGLKNWINITL